MFSGVCRAADRVHRALRPLLAGDNNLEFHLREKVDIHIIAPDLLLISHLRTAAHHLRDRHSMHLQLLQGILYILHLIFVNDRIYFNHDSYLHFNQYVSLHKSKPFAVHRISPDR